jgi:AraC family transcriptional regulator
VSSEQRNLPRVRGEAMVGQGLRMVYRTYAAGLRMGRHAHDEFRLCLPLRGAYIDSWRGNERTRKPRHLSLHPAGEVHTSRFLAPTACFHVEFTQDWRTRLLDIAAAEADEPQEFLDGKAPIVAAQLFAEFCRNDDCSPVIIEGLACELIGWCARHVRASRGVPPWLLQARDLLHDRFNEQLSVATVALTVDIHPVHLAREFKRAFGQTLGEYVRMLRVEHVCRRLGSAHDLAELAVEAGFSDQSHLTRVFKRIKGTTPGRFRMQR